MANVRAYRGPADLADRAAADLAQNPEFQRWQQGPSNAIRSAHQFGLTYLPKDAWINKRGEIVQPNGFPWKKMILTLGPATGIGALGSLGFLGGAAASGASGTGGVPAMPWTLKGIPGGGTGITPPPGTGGGWLDRLKGVGKKVVGDSEGGGFNPWQQAALAALAGLPALLANKGPSNEEKALYDQARQMTELQRRRIEHQNPLFSAVTQLAMSRLPTASQQPLQDL